MWIGIFGNVNKFRAVSYMILLIEISLLGKLVPKDFNSAVFWFFILSQHQSSLRKGRSDGGFSRYG
jgi:hypothetical protein